MVLVAPGEPSGSCREAARRSASALITVLSASSAGRPRLAVQARNVIDAYAFEVQDRAWVDVLFYGCSTRSSAAPIVSSEHETVAWLAATKIGADSLPAGYAQVIKQWRNRALG